MESLFVMYSELYTYGVIRGEIEERNLKFLHFSGSIIYHWNGRILRPSVYL
jgi:hypothetical protein